MIPSLSAFSCNFCHDFNFCLHLIDLLASATLTSTNIFLPKYSGVGFDEKEIEVYIIFYRNRYIGEAMRGSEVRQGDGVFEARGLLICS